MAGHSQFKNIMHRKGAQDAKRAKLFTKVGREIISACKTGAPDASTNPRLRSAIQWAREVNMPRDKIDAAIKRASGNNDSDNFESIRYEGYGPSGTAIIVQALTDNRNRTASDVRAAFSKQGGNMGETGSVAFMFDYIGRITYPGETASDDAMLMAAIDAGAQACAREDETHIITCAADDFGAVRDALEAKFGEAASAKLSWQPQNMISIEEEPARQLIKLLDTLDDHDDVQEVFTNADFPDSILNEA